MVKNLHITLTIVLFSGINLLAQTSYFEISTTAGYQSQQYIRLSDNKLASTKLGDWDIAFTSFGQQDAGVHINEASGTSMGQALPEIELYDPKTSDFQATIFLDSLNLRHRLYNDEKSWSYGAFNSTRISADPFDYGWGKYSPAVNKVSGEKLFVIKLRNGQLRKLMIESVVGPTYTFKYANLDGSNEVTKTVTKTINSQRLLYFSFDKSDFVNITPTDGYDLVYTRYTSIATDPNGTTTAQYNVTGILSAPSNTTAEIISDTPEAEQPTASTLYSKQYDIIGFDWKNFVGNKWELDTKKVFFVKSAVDKHIYKIRFIDFQGATTGNATIEKTDLGLSSATADEVSLFTNIYPNPVQSNLEVVLDNSNQKLKDAQLQVCRLDGQILSTQNIQINLGINAYSLNIEDLIAGLYVIRLTSKGETFGTKKIVKN
jgi:Secretion system C-terminal sorting domain/HmuY protein